MDSIAWRQLCYSRFPGLQLDCGKLSDPGVVDTDEWRDWSEFETTPDQLRIEDYLTRHNLREKQILHIGIGNSGLARRFYRRAQAITGTTVGSAELAKGRSLSLPNYDIFLHNKHLDEKPFQGRTFDFIVDNNPTAFCCCMKHLKVMFDWYSRILKPDGQIVTDRVGLGWTTELPLVRHRWRFDFDDLQALAPFFGLNAYQANQYTYLISRHRPNLGAFSFSAMQLVSRFLQGILSKRKRVLRILGFDQS